MIQSYIRELKLQMKLRRLRGPRGSRQATDLRAWSPAETADCLETLANEARSPLFEDSGEGCDTVSRSHSAVRTGILLEDLRTRCLTFGI